MTRPEADDDKDQPDVYEKDVTYILIDIWING